VDCVVASRRIYAVASALAVAAVACLVVAFLRRHHIEDSLGGVEGAYFNRSGGPPTFAGSGNVLDPFRIGNAYLWLGAGAGLLLAALSTALTARLAR
jgi:hypothetical protein